MKNAMIHVVDDNDAFRESLAWLLKSEGYDVSQHADATSAIEGITKDTAATQTRRCLLLDIRMPAMSGLDLHDQLNTRKLDIPVVYMTGHADVPLAVEAMKKGAITLLEKPLQNETLLSAISGALERSARNSGTRPPAETGASAMSEAERDHVRQLLDSLTPREHDVLECVVEGQANKVLAHTLGISIRTVEMHRSRVLKKLEVHSSPELVRKVLLYRQAVPYAEEAEA